MPTNEFLPFALTGVVGQDADVMPQADYLSSAARQSGHPLGAANRALFNKALRQSAAISSAVAAAVMEKTGSSVLDNGDMDSLVSLISAAFDSGGGGGGGSVIPVIVLQAGTAFTPGISTVVSIGGTFASKTDFSVFFDAAYQGPDTISFNATTQEITFNTAVPVGVGSIYVASRGGSGSDGSDGWTPVFAVVADGTRFVQKVVDWIGGTGTPPASDVYVGATGFVADIADAVDIGAADGTDGTNGWSPILATVSDGIRRVHQVVDWTGGTGTKPATGPYIGATGFVVAIADAVDIRGASGAGTGDMLKSENLSGLANYATARANLGATTVGGALFTAADAAAARSAIGLGSAATASTGDFAPSTVTTTVAAHTAALAELYPERELIVALGDETTTITTGTAKVTMRAPFAMTLTKIPRASVNTASTSGLPTVDINVAGTSVLGANKLSIDVNEKTSVTAATPTTLATTAIADDAEITFDVDVAGTGAKGLKVCIYYKRSA